MKRLSLLLVTGLLGVGAGAQAQPLVTGNGNFFSPIVQNLDKAVAFYRDGLGLETQGEPGNADNNEALRRMFGLPDAKIRWMIARPGGMRQGVEIVEITAGGKPLVRRPQDSGAFTLIAFVRDIDATLARLKKQGAPVVSAGGAPAVLPFGPGHTARMVVVKDPDGHFVEIVQPDEPPKTEAPATSNVVDVRVRLTVEDVEKSVKLYHDALGMEITNTPAFAGNATVGDALGVGKDAQFRFGMLKMPSTGLVFEVMDYKGVDRKTVRGDLRDPGSTRFQMQVRDIDAAVAAFTKAGGTFVSTGGKPLELPAPNGALKVGIVREPDNLFVVLIQSPPPAAK